MLGTAIAHAERALAAEPVNVVEFTGVAATKSGGTINDTKYSEKANDAEITNKEFADGVVTYTGQVGLGNGSSWAGIGLTVNVLPDGKTMDASQFKTVTFRVASGTTPSLRLRLVGSDEGTRSSGCYPIVTQAVTASVKEYTIPLAQFEAPGYCGAKAVPVAKTLPQLLGFEIADERIGKAPTRVLVGTITLNP
jgi:hypothetical protein